MSYTRMGRVPALNRRRRGLQGLGCIPPTDPVARAKWDAYVARGKREGWTPKGCGAPEALGDIFCFEGDCVVGKQLVNEMQAVYKQGSGYGVNEMTDAQVAFRQKFGPTVTQLIEQWMAEDSKLSRQIPFSLVCCTIKDIGVKAQSVTRQMRDYMKVAQPDRTPIESPHAPGSNPVSQTINSVLKGAFLLGAGYLAFNFISARTGR